MYMCNRLHQCLSSPLSKNKEDLALKYDQLHIPKNRASTTGPGKSIMPKLRMKYQKGTDMKLVFLDVITRSSTMNSHADLIGNIKLILNHDLDADITRGQFLKNYSKYSSTIMLFFKKTTPKQWREFRDTVTDNFCIMPFQNFLVLEG